MHRFIGSSWEPASYLTPWCGLRWQAPPGWSRLSGNWISDQAHTRCRSTCQGSPRSGGSRLVLLAHCLPSQCLLRSRDWHTYTGWLRAVPLEDNLVIPPLKEVGQPARPPNNHTTYLHSQCWAIGWKRYLFLDVCPLLLIKGLVVFIESRFTMPTYQQNEHDHL